MNGITASVGLGGRNRRPDVIAVQTLLRNAAFSPGAIDGRCGRLTIHAIEQFQRGILSHPDGRVDVGGPTIRRLASSPAKEGTSIHAGTGSAVPPRRPPGRFITAPPIPRGSPPARPSPPTSPVRAPAPYSFWTGKTDLPPPSVNAGLICPSSPQMTALLGDPNSAGVSSRIVTESVGPFRATGLTPALASLRAVFAQVHHDLPDLYGILHSRGMHVVRTTRGRSSYSNHSWGIAIDLRIAGESPPLGTRFSLRGLDALVPYFHRAGWYWGGGYRNETRKDPMHFECELALVRSFHT